MSRSRMQRRGCVADVLAAAPQDRPSSRSMVRRAQPQERPVRSDHLTTRTSTPDTDLPEAASSNPTWLTIMDFRPA